MPILTPLKQLLSPDNAPQVRTATLAVSRLKRPKPQKKPVPVKSRQIWIQSFSVECFLPALAACMWAWKRRGDRADATCEAVCQEQNAVGRWWFSYLGSVLKDLGSGLRVWGGGKKKSNGTKLDIWTPREYVHNVGKFRSLLKWREWDCWFE